MVCIYCSSETQVVNSRPQKRTNRVWRRRLCPQCGATFTSIEAPDLAKSIRVIDADHLQAFQRDKLFLSIYESLKHRKTALSDATGLTDTVIAQLYQLMQRAKLEKDSIVIVTLVILRRFDKVAATHYAAFHKLAD